MKCIYCGRPGTGVINSRQAGINGTRTWRRRHCSTCQKVFTTRETPAEDNLFVLKRNGTRQRFVYEKLFASVFVILNNRKGPDNGASALLAKKTAAAIMAKAAATTSSDRTITTAQLIQCTYEQLRRVGREFAEHYIYYSEHRRKIGTRRGLI